MSFKKIDNFFYHYKYHTLIIGIVMILSGSFLYTFIDRQLNAATNDNHELDIMLFGDFLESDATVLSAKLKKDFPEWQSIHINFVYAPHAIDSQETMAARQKNQGTIQTEKPDIYIFDRHFFDHFIEDGPFLKLTELGSHDSGEFHQRENDDQAYVYGIRLFQNDSDIKEMIAVVRADTTNKTRALELLTEYRKTTK